MKELCQDAINPMRNSLIMMTSEGEEFLPYWYDMFLLEWVLLCSLRYLLQRVQAIV